MLSFDILYFRYHDIYLLFYNLYEIMRINLHVNTEFFNHNSKRKANLIRDYDIKLYLFKSESICTEKYIKNCYVRQ